MKPQVVLPFLLFVSLISSSFSAHAWGRRGHSLVCETAAYVASHGEKKEGDVHFLKMHSYDLGYYCNVPDFIWKRPDNYSNEYIHHFMNLEAFDKKISSGQLEDKSPYRLSRKDFLDKYKEVSEKKGRSWWRLQELEKELKKITEKLKDKKLNRKQKQELQAQWFLHAGVMGHYIGDLAMPLHVSENYDGQLTDQKGLHHYFEETIVDELYLQKNFGLQEAVYNKAISQWDSFKKNAKGKDLLKLIYELSRDSQKSAQKLLEIDKKTGRTKFDSSVQSHKDLLVTRLTQGVLYQAYLLNNHLGWDFDGKDFYNFIETPEFIKPPSR